MDLERAIELQYSCLAVWMRTMATSSEGGQLVESDGVTGAVIPVTPDRSIPNSVTFSDASALGAALDQLAAAYDEAGVNAWTVWTPDVDREAIALLEDAGHVFDGQPAAMTLELAELAELDLGDLDWDSGADPHDVGRVNDLAYGFEAGSFGAAIGTPPADPALRFYQARVEGEVASVVQTIDAAGDCGIYFVATLPAYRGRALSTRLMSVALAEARERGCATSTLQASPMGYPVYERLGYRTFCRMHLYERRPPGG
jgi:GNAT superfamily N-acetyltransferase